MSDADTLMTEIGLGSASGPFANELRASLAKQAAAGVQRMHVSWNGGDSEERARELLAVDWEISHGHTYRVEAIDGGLYTIQTNLRSGRRRLRIHWAWFGDQFRRTGCDIRRAAHRLAGIRNPYRVVANSDQ
jgi:hypothetical protein